MVYNFIIQGDLGDALETMQKQLRTLMKMVELFNQICQDEKGKTEDAAKQDEDLKTGNAEQEVEVASFGSAVETASIPTTNGAFNTTVSIGPIQPCTTQCIPLNNAISDTRWPRVAFIQSSYFHKCIV